MLPLSFVLLASCSFLVGSYCTLKILFYCYPELRLIMDLHHQHGKNISRELRTQLNDMLKLALSGFENEERT